MTPERQKWWDSLPKEEKRVRMDIELCKKQIKWQKRNFSLYTSIGFKTDHDKIIIKFNKRLIKALRKQIGMQVLPCKNMVPFENEYYHCSQCGFIVDVNMAFKGEYYCRNCGQKVKW